MIRSYALAIILLLYSCLLFIILPAKSTPPTPNFSETSLSYARPEAGGFALDTPTEARKAMRVSLSTSIATPISHFVGNAHKIVAQDIIIRTAPTLTPLQPSYSQQQVIYTATTPVALQIPPTAKPLVVVANDAQVQPQAYQPPAPQQVTGPPNVIIQGIFFDGLVYRSESDEYATITNIGEGPVNLRGWRLNAGDAKQDFTFPDFTLGPGLACRVYTNEFHSDTCGFSFGIAHAIWNNEGDCGSLYDASGVQVSSSCYAGTETTVPLPNVLAPTAQPTYPASSIVYDAPAIPVQPDIPNDVPAIAVQPVLPQDLPAIPVQPSFPTPVLPVQYPQKGQRYGAICRDGWQSHATESGACRHHQGGDYWLIYQ